MAYSHESGAYVEDIVDVSDAFRVNAGVRYSDSSCRNLHAHRPGNKLLEPADTMRYGKGELVERYGGWEPRLSARLKTRDPEQVSKQVYPNYQYVYLAPLSATTTPTDWFRFALKGQANQWFLRGTRAQQEWECSVNCTTKIWTTSSNTLRTRGLTKTSPQTHNNLVLGRESRTEPSCLVKRKVWNAQWMGRLHGAKRTECSQTQQWRPLPCQI